MSECTEPRTSSMPAGMAFRSDKKEVGSPLKERANHTEPHMFLAWSPGLKPLASQPSTRRSNFWVGPGIRPERSRGPIAKPRPRQTSVNTSWVNPEACLRDTNPDNDTCSDGSNGEIIHPTDVRVRNFPVKGIDKPALEFIVKGTILSAGGTWLGFRNQIFCRISLWVGIIVQIPHAVLSSQPRPITATSEVASWQKINNLRNPIAD